MQPATCHPITNRTNRITIHGMILCHHLLLAIHHLTLSTHVLLLILWYMRCDLLMRVSLSELREVVLVWHDGMLRGLGHLHW